MVACSNLWNYPHHVQFPLNQNGKMCYVSAFSFGESRVMGITECHLPEPSINSFWPQLEFEPGTNVKRVFLRAGIDDDMMLALESDSPEPPGLEIEAGISVAHVYEENAVLIAGN